MATSVKGDVSLDVAECDDVHVPACTERRELHASRRLFCLLIWQVGTADKGRLDGSGSGHGKALMAGLNTGR